MLEEYLASVAIQLNWPMLALALGVSIAILAKSADTLVETAVKVSIRWGIPPLIVGATIISLGTTFPEVVVSVLAAVQGKPGLAMGNAVGSIICDTGLIMGIACLIRPIPLNRRIVNRQGWIQLAAATLLVLVSIPYSNPAVALTTGGVMTQYTGFAFLMLLGLYILASLRWAKDENYTAESNTRGEPMLKMIIIAAIAMTALALSSQSLIAAAAETARRIEIPQSVIAATIVAFGTSLPELVTAVSAVLKGHGQIAVGNVIGADILNALLVAGAAAAVTPEGLEVGPHFFTGYFPAMMGILIVFRIGVFVSKDSLGRGFGLALLGIYLASLVTSYV